MDKTTTSIVWGIVLGFAFSKLLFLQYLTLIPWALAGAAIGYTCKSIKEAVKYGGLYGFSLGFVFMAAVYGGGAPFINRIPFFALMGLVSSVCALILSISGFQLRTLLIKRMTKRPTEKTN